jgi:3-deoxy-manno-octulosonate cytidylyltransferase (CMP-KDO synthetase)
VSVLAVVPARMGSTRFPGKPLALLAGRPLVEHAWAAVSRAPSVSRVLVATDSEAIAAAARAFGAEAVMTRSDHPSGTDRVAEAAARAGGGYDVVVNVQGDEPLLDPEAVEAVLAALAGPGVRVATLASPESDRAALADRNVVKVVCDQSGDALLFSRAPIGEPMGGTPAGWSFLRHVGVYAFRREALLEFAAWPPGALESAERLEPLRLLEHGRKIRVAVVRAQGRGVDTPSDLAALERDWHHSAPADPGAPERGGARP